MSQERHPGFPPVTGNEAPSVEVETEPQTHDELLDALGKHVRMLDRAVLGYNAVSEWINNTQAQIPVLEFQAKSRFTNDIREVSLDLQLVFGPLSPEARAQILGELLNRHALDYSKCLEEIIKTATTMLQQTQQAIASATRATGTA